MVDSLVTRTLELLKLSLFLEGLSFDLIIKFSLYFPLLRWEPDGFFLSIIRSPYSYQC